MQKRVTFADEVLPNVRRTPVHFWDGMKVPCLTPSITSKGKCRNLGLFLARRPGSVWRSLFGVGDVMDLYVTRVLVGA